MARVAASPGASPAAGRAPGPWRDVSDTQNPDPGRFPRRRTWPCFCGQSRCGVSGQPLHPAACVLSFCKHRPSSSQILGQLSSCLVCAVAEVAEAQWDEGTGFHSRLTFGKRGVVTTKDAGPFQVLGKLSWLKQRLWCRVARGGLRRLSTLWL